MSGLYQPLLGAAFAVVMVAAAWFKFRKDYRAITAFDGDDIRYFKIPAQDFMAPRIIKRVEAVGWELVQRERASDWNCDYLIFKAGEDAQPLSNLLKKLHRAGFSVKPKRVLMDCEGNCGENDGQTH